MTENHVVRDRAKAAKVPLWKVAAEIQVSEPTLTRWLRFPLPAEKETRILTAIETIAERGGANVEKGV